MITTPTRPVNRGKLFPMAILVGRAKDAALKVVMEVDPRKGVAQRGGGRRPLDGAVSDEGAGPRA